VFEQFIGTKPVEERHRIDVASLERFLGMKVRDVEQFKGGQSNPTYRIIAVDGRRFVLRRKPPGKLLPSAHAVEREFRVTKALYGKQFPVARPHVLCEDESVIGTAFYVMDYVEGRVLWDPSLPGMSRAERGAIWDEQNRVISQLHQIDYRAIGLEDFGKPGNYIGRQVERWAEHELRIQAVAAFLQVTAVGHLRDDVRGAKHLADAAQQRVREPDGFRRALVAGVVHQRAGGRRQRREADLAHIAAQERGAARHVRQGVLGAEAVAMVVPPAQIAEVVEQGGERADNEDLAWQLGLASAAAALVAVHQARHGERHVEHVLDIVVLRVAGQVVRMPAGIEGGVVGKGALELGHRGAVIEPAIDAEHLAADRLRIGGPDGVGDVVVVAAHYGRLLFARGLSELAV
jgi:hypothetical protein